MSSNVTRTSIESALHTQQALNETAPAFGFEEMLTELEAIISEAEIRLAEEETA